MAEVAGVEAPWVGTRRIVFALYALLAVSATSLAVLVLGDIVYSFEDHVQGEHEHGWYGPIFDGAWLVFLPSFGLTALAGIAAVVGGVLAHSRPITRAGLFALAFCVLAVFVVVAADSLS